MTDHTPTLAEAVKGVSLAETRTGGLEERLLEAVRAYEAMSPIDRALHDADQRRSFVRGQCGRDPGPNVLAEEVRRLRTLLDRAAEVLGPFAEIGRAIPATETDREIYNYGKDELPMAVDDYCGRR